MRGAESVIAARLAGIPVHRIVIDVLPQRLASRDRWIPPGVESLRGEVIGRLEVYADDVPGALDLRCCHRLPVSVYAPSYALGWPVAQRVTDSDPASLIFASLDYAARYDESTGLQAWEM